MPGKIGAPTSDKTESIEVIQRRILVKPKSSDGISLKSSEPVLSKSSSTSKLQSRVSEKPPVKVSETREVASKKPSLEEIQVTSKEESLTSDKVISEKDKELGGSDDVSSGMKMEIEESGELLHPTKEESVRESDSSEHTKNTEVLRDHSEKLRKSNPLELAKKSGIPDFTQLKSGRPDVSHSSAAKEVSRPKEIGKSILKTLAAPLLFLWSIPKFLVSVGIWAYSNTFGRIKNHFAPKSLRESMGIIGLVDTTKDLQERADRLKDIAKTLGKFTATTGYVWGEIQDHAIINKGSDLPKIPGHVYEIGELVGKGEHAFGLMRRLSELINVFADRVDFQAKFDMEKFLDAKMGGKLLRNRLEVANKVWSALDAYKKFLDVSDSGERAQALEKLTTTDAEVLKAVFRDKVPTSLTEIQQAKSDWEKYRNELGKNAAKLEETAKGLRKKVSGTDLATKLNELDEVLDELNEVLKAGGDISGEQGLLDFIKGRVEYDLGKGKLLWDGFSIRDFMKGKGRAFFWTEWTLTVSRYSSNLASLAHGTVGTTAKAVANCLYLAAAVINTVRTVRASMEAHHLKKNITKFREMLQRRRNEKSLGEGLDKFKSRANQIEARLQDLPTQLLRAAKKQSGEKRRLAITDAVNQAFQGAAYWICGTLAVASLIVGTALAFTGIFTPIGLALAGLGAATAVGMGIVKTSNAARSQNRVAHLEKLLLRLEQRSAKEKEILKSKLQETSMLPVTHQRVEEEYMKILMKEEPAASWIMKSKLSKYQGKGKFADKYGGLLEKNRFDTRTLGIATRNELMKRSSNFLIGETLKGLQKEVREIGAPNPMEIALGFRSEDELDVSNPDSVCYLLSEMGFTKGEILAMGFGDLKTGTALFRGKTGMGVPDRSGDPLPSLKRVFSASKPDLFREIDLAFLGATPRKEDSKDVAEKKKQVREQIKSNLEALDEALQDPEFQKYFLDQVNNLKDLKELMEVYRAIYPKKAPSSISSEVVSSGIPKIGKNKFYNPEGGVTHISDLNNELCGKLGLQRVRVPTDGHCFYHAAFHQLNLHFTNVLKSEGVEAPSNEVILNRMAEKALGDLGSSFLEDFLKSNDCSCDKIAQTPLLQQKFVRELMGNWVESCYPKLDSPPLGAGVVKRAQSRADHDINKPTAGVEGWGTDEDAGMLAMMFKIPVAMIGSGGVLMVSTDKVFSEVKDSLPPGKDRLILVHNGFSHWEPAIPRD